MKRLAGLLVTTAIVAIALTTNVQAAATCRGHATDDGHWFANYANWPEREKDEIRNMATHDLLSAQTVSGPGCIRGDRRSLPRA